MLYENKSKVYSQRKFELDNGEYNSGESNVDPSGYIPMEEKYKNFLRAGKNLLDHRLEEYDYLYEPTDEEIDRDNYQPWDKELDLYDHMEAIERANNLVRSLQKKREEKWESDTEEGASGEKIQPEQDKNGTVNTTQKDGLGGDSDDD